MIKCSADVQTTQNQKNQFKEAITHGMVFIYDLREL